MNQIQSIQTRNTMMKMKSVYRTLAKTSRLLHPQIRVSQFSLSSYSNSNTEKSVAQEGSMEEKDEIEKGRAKNWAKPSEIPFQPKVANWVNLIGTIRMPVRFLTSSDGKSWAATVISQEQLSSTTPLLRIPIVFEGDLAHTAATHLKTMDNVYVAGQLNPDPLPINMTNDQVNVQVMVHDVHFVRGSNDLKRNFQSLKTRTARP